MGVSPGEDRRRRRRTVPTARQLAVLRMICNALYETGRFPTVQEIAEHFGVHANAAHEHLMALVRKGYLSARQPGRHRSFGVLRNADGDSVAGWHMVDALLTREDRGEA